MTASGDEGFAYVGYRPCGCMCMATSDQQDRQKDVAKFVRKIISNGLRLERVPDHVVRANPWHCAVCRPSVAPSPQLNLEVSAV